MKTLLCLSVFLLITWTSFGAKIPFASHGVRNAATQAASSNTPPDSLLKSSSVDVFTTTYKGDEVVLRRRLTLQEKIKWFFFKKLSPRTYSDPIAVQHANSNALLGFIFSILGITVFPLFSIPAYILSRKALKAEKAQPGILTRSNWGLAKAGEIISIVDIAALIIGITFVIIWITRLSAR